MTIKITKSTDIIEVKNLITVLYGDPGSGKTSLGFSAKNPLLIDADLGAHRAIGRKSSAQVNLWADIADLNAQDLKDYDTIIIDTAGRILEILAQELMAGEPKFRRRTGEITLQGYGALGAAFKTWINKLKSFEKDIILILHAKEEKDGDIKYIRLDAPGSNRDEIVKIADLIGYVHLEGKKRMLDFNPSEKHLGKNSASLDPQFIPAYADNPNFLNELLDVAKKNMNQKTKEQIEAEANFNILLEQIQGVSTLEDCTKLIPLVKDQIALKTKLHHKATKELGGIFDKEKGCYKIEKLEVSEDIINEVKQLIEIKEIALRNAVHEELREACKKLLSNNFENLKLAEIKSLKNQLASI